MLGVHVDEVQDVALGHPAAPRLLDEIMSDHAELRKVRAWHSGRGGPLQKFREPVANHHGKNCTLTDRVLRACLARYTSPVSAVRALHTAVARALASAGVGSDDAIVAACSHGPDSLALAAALIDLRPGRIAIVHVDHGLRAEARAEAERTVAFGAARGVRAVAVPVSVVERGEGLEAAAREARHAALLAAADRLEIRWIALGHTAGDQTETVLHRLIRGAGSAGLAGIAPRRDRFLRPLLEIDRPLVEAYLAERGLEPSRDPMNDDRRFLRARLRHDIVPLLRAENPELDRAVGRAAAALRELDDALAWMADKAEAEVTVGPACLDAAALARHPAAVQKRLLARLARRLGSSLEAAHLDALVALAARPARGSLRLDLPGLQATREYDHLVLGQAREAARPLPRVEILDDPAGEAPFLQRGWQPGDRMRPASLRGRSRKLQDLFTDRKVPARVRREAVVIVRVRDQEIVWAEHIGSSVHSRVQVALTRGDPPVIYD